MRHGPAMQRSKSLASATLVLLCFPYLGICQTVSITGTVKDSATSQAISGVAVSLIGNPATATTTNASGEFALVDTTTAAINQSRSISTRFHVALSDNALTITTGNPTAEVSVGVNNAAGILVYRATKSAKARVVFNGLFSAPGSYYVKVRVGDAERTYTCFGASIQDMKTLSIAERPVSPLAKGPAVYTVAFSKAGYGEKRVTTANGNAALGTIKLKAISTALGVWTNVTPAGISLDPDFGGSAGSGQNYGVCDVLVDPVRPMEFYAFTCYQGVWKSTDAGASFTRITAAGVMTAGRAWGETIDPSPNRDPDTPPTLWASQGYGGDVQGCFKSVDGGITWTSNAGGGSAGIYSIDADPYDKNHLIGGVHEANGVIESSDGGANWRTIATPGPGNSIFPFFVNTGFAASTRTTWLAVGQIDAGGTLYRTNSGGADWGQVLGAGHPHGSSQLCSTGPGVYFFAGYGSGGGVFKSTDFGQTWSLVSTTDGSSIVATPNYIYTSSCQFWPGNGGTDGAPKLQRAPRNPGTAWTAMPAPVGMNDGSHRMAAGFDGVHYVVVGGNGRNGIWRYVEP